MDINECRKALESITKITLNQTAKADAGKPRVSLTPTEIDRDIARIREYGCNKYPGDPNNWKTVAVERYRDAAYRHLLAYIDDPAGKDEESNLPHLWHLAYNVAFLCELEKDNFQSNVSDVKVVDKETHIKECHSDDCSWK